VPYFTFEITTHNIKYIVCNVYIYIYRVYVDYNAKHTHVNLSNVVRLYNMQENLVFAVAKHEFCRFQLSRGLGCGNATARLLVLQVLIPPVV